VADLPDLQGYFRIEGYFRELAASGGDRKHRGPELRACREGIDLLPIGCRRGEVIRAF
jgi:hypothetical protein